jgi:membrane-associated protease RseP (regulator of RpoE activity)
MSRFKIRQLGLTWWRLVEILGLALTLFLIIYATIFALLQAEHGMSWDASFRVKSLLPGGPAEQAGIQLGDQILTIEGHPIDAWRLPVTHWRPGDTLRVVLERNGRHFIRLVTLAPLSLIEKGEAIAPLIVAPSFWVASSLMPGIARQDTEVQLFRAFSQVGSAMLAIGNLSTAGLIWAGHLFGVLAGALAPLLLHFHLTLPGARLEQWRRPILLVTYAIGAVVALPYLMLGPVSYWWWAGWRHSGLRIALASALLSSLIWLG